jgi:hypothetical protein
MSEQRMALLSGSDIHVMLTLRRLSHQVIVANKQLDGTNVIGEFLGKRQRGAHQLTKLAIAFASTSSRCISTE